MKVLIKIILISSLFILSCDDNSFIDLESEETDSSLWFEVQQLMNDKDFTSAIEKLNDVSEEFKTRRENLIQYASAFAGFCGLDLLTLLDESTSLGGATPIQFFMNTFGTTSPEQIAACEFAISIIESNVSVLASERNDDENIAMMAFLMTVVGLEMNEKFNLSTSDHNDTCLPVNISDADSALLGSYLSKMFSAATELTVVDVLDEIKDTISEGCDLLSPIMDFCSAIDPGVYTTSQIRGVRSILQEGEVFGMGTCSSSPDSLANCLCP